MSGDLVVSSEDGIVVVRMDRAEKVNAIAKDHLSRLAQAIRDARDSSGVVLTGAGGNFSSGFDLDELTGTPEDDEIDDLLAEVDHAIEEVPVPVVAAVEGACVGAACDLAVMCDLVVAGESAFFAVPAIRMGVLYRTAAVREVFTRAGSQGAALLFLFGERMPAPTAQACGLIAEVVLDGEALARARTLLDGSTRGVPEAVAATKKLLRALRRGDVDDAVFGELGRAVADSPARALAVERARQRR